MRSSRWAARVATVELLALCRSWIGPLQPPLLAHARAAAGGHLAAALGMHCWARCSALPARLPSQVPSKAVPLPAPSTQSCSQIKKFAMCPQASIVGNMKHHGLLEGAEQTTYIEYGAGKGYLWCALRLGRNAK